MIQSLSIVVPAYNEEKRLPATLDRLVAYMAERAGQSSEVIVVDDGSRDGTAALVNQYAASHPGVRLLSNPGNRGKGYAVRHGMLDARSDWNLITDADLSTPIEELDKLYAAAQRLNALIAIGSRALDRSLIGVHQPLIREYSGRVFNGVMRMITGLPYADTQCGFKLYARDAAQQIFSRQQLDGFSFDVEDLVIAKALGIPAVEVPVRWNNAEGTKVSTTQGLKSFSDLMKIRGFRAAGKYR